jgi:hypothetical protein
MKRLLVVLLAVGIQPAFAQRPVPNANSDRPGFDPQTNIGSTITNAPYSNTPNAQRNPPDAPPGWRDPRISDAERKNVNPENVENAAELNRSTAGPKRGPAKNNFDVETQMQAPNVDYENKEQPTHPKVGSPEWSEEQR